ncbi:iron-sulfur cluster-binding domain-containing protein, partial [Staphylococcus gallinarum]|uniref:2Fe-2S iron-sulfur cluster binding domain-containing protein n=1 Tax=Staphylococcus gallinarum TaxID=1293 RepID=UPI00316EEC27
EEMIFCVKDFLTKKQIPEKQIHFELFTTSAAKSQKKIASSNDTERGCKVTIKLDGRFLEFDLPFDTNNILDAALQQGADLPYA